MLATLPACRTVNPTTGAAEFDAVKTEKVRGVMKPIITEAVSRVVEKAPEARLYFEQAAGVVCELRDARKFDPVNLRARLFGILDASTVRVDPLIRTGFNTAVAIFEINYADRLRADLPEEGFVWNLMDVLCDGLRGGLAGSGSVAITTRTLLYTEPTDPRVELRE